MKKLSIGVLVIGLITRLITRRRNRPQNWYFEYLSPKVLLVAREDLYGAEFPTYFTWAKQIDTVWYCYRAPNRLYKVTKVSDFGWSDFDRILPWAQKQSPSTTVQPSKINTHLKNALSQQVRSDKTVLLIADAKTIAYLRRNVQIWSPTPSSTNRLPISRYLHSIAEYMAA